MAVTAFEGVEDKSICGTSKLFLREVRGGTEGRGRGWGRRRRRRRGRG